MFDLNVCRISRRGKGAKGTVEVKTLGTPILDDDGIAKDWDYSKFINADTAELVVFLQQFGNVNVAMVSGIDDALKSETMKAQNEAVILASRLLSDELEPNQDEADKRARIILQTVKNLKQSSGIDEDSDNVELLTTEYWYQKHARFVAKKKKEASMLPNLVKK